MEDFSCGNRTSNALNYVFIGGFGTEMVLHRYFVFFFDGIEMFGNKNNEIKVT